ncbi:MAG: hypothetical protein AAF224_05250 [Pseudomonadota bacterium]
MTAPPNRKSTDTSEDTEDSAANGAAVFDRVGDELEQMASATHRLQMSIGVLLDDYIEAHGSAPVDLQEVDVITQTLENLAQFMNALKPPDDLALDSETAAKYLTLKALADRLANPNLPTTSRDDDDADSGELDLF